LDPTVDRQAAWPDAIHAHFRRARIRQVGYVPDAGHSRLIQRCIEDPDIADVVLTTEEEGVGWSPAPRSAGTRGAPHAAAAWAIASICSR
jgi:sulfopyruvate decarboxylase TPP-binding subunit